MKNKSLLRLAIPLGALCLMLVVQDSAVASGSWGSRGGSWGSRGFSRGSWGASRGFRTPVRNFFANRRAMWGSGGSIGGRSVGGYSSYGSRGTATWGSTGGFGSAGYGNMGSYSGAQSYVSTASTPTFDSYPSMDYSVPTVSSGYPITGSSSFGCSDCAPGMSTMGTGIPVESGIIATEGMVMPSTGGIVQPGGIIDGGTVPGVPYYEGAPVDGVPSIPTEGSGAKDQFQAPVPQPEGETTSTRMHNRKEAVLNVALPLDAKVYVNGKLTKTTGSLRSYVSRKLKPGRNYAFNVKAIAERDGRQITLNRRVVMSAGIDRAIEFDFEGPQLTQLSVRVPENAKVTLAGNETHVTGNMRHYKTKLEPGETWNGYKVVVSIEKNGKTIRHEKKLDIVAGQSYVLDFRSSSADMIASK